MEPGHEDREYDGVPVSILGIVRPQWSPVMKTGNTVALVDRRADDRGASMEPGHEDREYVLPRRGDVRLEHASMEPGHEDREYLIVSMAIFSLPAASMEPGHEDREYAKQWRDELDVRVPQWSPVMKTGNTRRGSRLVRRSASLNGARS